MTALLLSYQRVGEYFEGTVGDTPFERHSFSDMMLMVSARIIREGVSQLNLQRTDRAGLAMVTMEPAMFELLTSDPAEYVRLHSPPARRVVVRGAPSRASKGTVPLLRVGHDTLAAAFGDVIYLRIRSGRVESPDTGRWDRLAVVEARMNLREPLTVVYTDEESMSGWALVSTAALLEHTQPIFYLPRAWNPHGGWIQSSQLREMYDKYQKEKIQCLLATA